MNSLYLAKINLPLKISESGEIDVLQEHITMNIESCNELPEKQDFSELATEIIKQLYSVHDSQQHTIILPPEPVSEPMILSKEEIISYPRKTKSENHQNTLKIFRRCNSTRGKTAKRQ